MNYKLVSVVDVSVIILVGLFVEYINTPEVFNWFKFLLIVLAVKFFMFITSSEK